MLTNIVKALFVSHECQLEKLFLNRMSLGMHTNVLKLTFCLIYKFSCILKFS